MSTTPNPLTAQAPATATATPEQSVTTPSADGVSVAELAGAIKQKFPAYKDVNDHELVSSTIQKFPVYQTKLSTGGLQDLLTTSNQFNLEKYLRSDEAKQIKKWSEDTVFGSAGAGGLASGMKLAMEKGAGTVGAKIVEHEMVDNAGNPLVTKVERGAVGKAREIASNAYEYVKANPKTAAVASYLAYKAGIDPAKILHMLHLIGE